MSKTQLAEIRLSKVIPKGTLELQKKEIAFIVKKTENNELHTIFTKAKGFFKMFEVAVKDEFTARVKKAKSKKERIVTDVGALSFVSRSNFEYDFEKINKFIETKEINEELIYDYSYTVNTRNAKVLASLLDKGHVAVKKKISPTKLAELAETYPKLLDFVEDNPTEYTKGL